MYTCLSCAAGKEKRGGGRGEIFVLLLGREQFVLIDCTGSKMSEVKEKEDLWIQKL